MKKDLPIIPYESKSINDYGVEIITIESLYDRIHDLNHRIDIAHLLGFNLLVFYTGGQTKHLIDFVWHEVYENTLMHIAKGQVNAFQFQRDTKGFLVLFTNEYLKDQLSQLPNSEVVRLFNSNLFSPRIQVPKSANVLGYFQLFMEEYLQEKNRLHRKTLDSLFTIIFTKLEQLKQDQTFHVENNQHLEVFLVFKKLLESDFTKSRNADYYASKLNITYKHLNVICKEVVNTTAKNFIDEFIVLEAKRNLINSTIKSNELAYKMGFNEPTNFVKYFKKHTGFTPNSFKKQYL